MNTTGLMLSLSIFVLGPPDTPKPDGETKTVRVGPLSLQVPADWHTQKPASSMRLGEIIVPAKDEDAQPLTIVAYHFPRQGGSVDANVKRWFDQFKHPPGESPESLEKREDVRVGDVTVTLVETTGTYQDRGPMMRGQGVAKPDSMLLGAIIPNEAGSYFFKFVGPKKTLTEQRDNFRKAILSFKFDNP